MDAANPGIPPRPIPRRDALQLAFATLMTTPFARGDEQVAVPPIGARIRDLADRAPLADRFTGATADECRRWQSGFAARLTGLLGPHRPPSRWETRVERVVTLDDHVREERVLTAERLPPVPVALLLPRPGSTTRRPAILAIHGHGPFGHDPVAGRDDTPALRKEIAASHYDYGRQLVRRGYVVAAPCLTPFGRRRGEGRLGGDACGQAFLGLQLLGKLLIAENLRDILWTFESLAAHESVDPDRIGCVGLSYGGRMTMLTSALEPRIRVAVISGALNCLQERAGSGNAAGCQTIPGLLQYGDVPEIGSLIAPRPCVWEVGTRDALISPEWADAAIARMRRAYKALGAEDRLKIDRFDGGHEWHGTVAYPSLDEVLKT